MVARGRVRQNAGHPPVLALSGPSGAGKTRLLRRLIPILVARGLRVAVLKHTRHRHPLDVRGKDTDVLRRAGAVAAAISAPTGVACFGPPAHGLPDLLRLLPTVDLVLVEGWRAEPLPRIEVHRRSVSRTFLCADDPRILAVVSDERPPRDVPWFRPVEVERVATWLVRYLRRRVRTQAKGGPASLGVKR